MSFITLNITACLTRFIEDRRVSPFGIVIEMSGDDSNLRFS